MIKRTVTDPQKSDMGDGFGEFQFSPETTLGDFIQEFVNTNKSWGVFEIYSPNGELLRKFDYDLWGKEKSFPLHLSWELKFKIKTAKFRYCFMNEDIVVRLIK